MIEIAALGGSGSVVPNQLIFAFCSSTSSQLVGANVLKTGGKLLLNLKIACGTGLFAQVSPADRKNSSLAIVPPALSHMQAHEELWGSRKPNNAVAAGPCGAPVFVASIKTLCAGMKDKETQKTEMQRKNINS